MTTTPSNASSAKDDRNTVDLEEIALAMHADSTFMSDAEYEAKLAQVKARRLASRRDKINQPRKPLHATRFAAFCGGLIAGAILTMIATASTITAFMAG